MPLTGFFCAMFIPLPVLFYRLKLGRTMGRFVPVVTGLTLFMIAGISFDVLVFIELLLLGFYLGEFFEQKLSLEKTVLYACGVVLGTATVCLLLYCSLTDTGISALISKYVASNLALSIALYKSIGMPEEHIQLLSDSMEHIRYVLTRIMPALSVILVLFLCWTSLLFSRPILKSRKLFYPEFGSLNLWRLPEYVVWAAIGSALMLFFPGSGLKLIGLNSVLILMAVYFLQGIAIISFFFEKKEIPRIFRFFLYSLIAVWHLLLAAVIGLGLFDTWLNFRKLAVNKKD
jgi:uncharacterized protein YybS (DUF2232 family)